MWWPAQRRKCKVEYIAMDASKRFSIKNGVGGERDEINPNERAVKTNAQRWLDTNHARANDEIKKYFSLSSRSQSICSTAAGLSARWRRHTMPYRRLYVALRVVAAIGSSHAGANNRRLIYSVVAANAQIRESSNDELHAHWRHGAACTSTRCHRLATERRITWLDTCQVRALAVITVLGTQTAIVLLAWHFPPM